MRPITLVLLSLGLTQVTSCAKKSSAPPASPGFAGGVLQTSGGLGGYADAGLSQTATRILGITGGSDSDKQAVASAKLALTFPAFGGSNADADHVVSNLDLPSELDGGVAVAWLSGNKAISDAGVVTRPAAFAANVTGTLQATLTRGQASALATFGLTVLAQDPSDSDAVKHVAAGLGSGVLGQNTALTAVTSNLTLSTSGAYGTSISWATSNSSVVTTAGVVTQPPYTASDATVTLTATVTKNAASATGTVDVTVLRALPPLLITEVYGAQYINEGWAEILNTTNAAIDLSQYGLRYCNATYNCTSIQSSALPSMSLPAGAYLLVHVPMGSSGNDDNGKTDIYISGMILIDEGGMFEITKAGVTIDFVRWQLSGYNYVDGSPLTGSFNGVVVAQTNNFGTSIGRTYPYKDTFAASDWTYYPFATPGAPNSNLVAGVDSDGDGIPDDVEANGLPGVDLKAMGADPDVRDIFVQLDTMENPAGHGDSLTDSTLDPVMLPLRKAALDRVVAAFDAYTPAPGAPNQHKIKIHFDVGPLFDNKPGAIDPENYNLGGGNQIPFARCIYLGTDNVHTSANCANVYDLKQQYFAEARRFIFHYFVIGWSQQTDGSPGSSGLAELGGNDGIITLGDWGFDDEQLTINFQAATIFHELGHNLGLQHGGFEATNYKPNYNSTMNYMYQLEGLDPTGDGNVFYSNYYANDPTNYPPRAKFTSLDIAEDSPGFLMNYSHGTNTTLNEASLKESQGWAGKPIDFNNNNVIDGGTVQANVQPGNYNTANTDVLADYDDWSNLMLNFASTMSANANGAGPVAGLTDSDAHPPLSPPCAGPPIFNDALEHALQ